MPRCLPYGCQPGAGMGLGCSCYLGPAASLRLQSLVWMSQPCLSYAEGNKGKSVCYSWTRIWRREPCSPTKVSIVLIVIIACSSPILGMMNLRNTVGLWSCFYYLCEEPPPSLGCGLVRKNGDFVVGLPAQPSTSTSIVVPGIPTLVPSVLSTVPFWNAAHPVPGRLSSFRGGSYGGLWDWLMQGEKLRYYREIE